MRMIVGCLFIAVLGILLVSGCTQRQNQVSTGSFLNLKTCAEQHGHECDVGVDCECGWLDASDTFYCCKCECTAETNQDDLLTIDTFDENPENEELGEIYE